MQRINKKENKVAVVGLGYVGLPLVNLCGKKGFNVIGYDIDSDWVKDIEANKFDVAGVNNNKFSNLVDEKQVVLTDKPGDLANADIILITVPTPLNEYKDPDLSYVKSATKTIAKNLSRNTLVILESTTYPGTTEDILVPIIEEESNLKVGQDVFVSYSPERLDPGNSEFDLDEIPKVIGGIDEKSTELTSDFYSLIFSSVHTVSNAKNAEMTKLLENIYRLVNISLINEMSLIADRLDIDIWEVVEAAKTKPYGFKAFYPGLGAGGHCIPLDPFYLSWKAKEEDFMANFISLAGEINYKMPRVGVNKIMEAMNENEKPVKNSNFLVLGVAYKKNLADYRESPVVKLIELLKNKGGNIRFYDSYVDDIILPKSKEEMSSLKSFGSVDVKEYDCTIIGTPHDNLNYEVIANKSKILIDFSNTVEGNKENIYKF